jgi:hypothetical protein
MLYVVTGGLTRLQVKLNPFPNAHIINCTSKCIIDLSELRFTLIFLSKIFLLMTVSAILNINIACLQSACNAATSFAWV